MGRPREFDTPALLRQASDLFARRGYAATSIDEVVKVTGVARGSLYSIFGSKQGIFAAALKRAAGQRLGSRSPGERLDMKHYHGDPAEAAALLDLLNVAILEMASHNHEISDLVQRIIDTHGITAQALGQRALVRAGLTEAAL